MDNLKKIDKKWLILGTVVVLLLLWLGFGNSSNKQSDTSESSDKGRVYQVKSSDDEVTGNIEVGSTDNVGRTQFYYTFLINDKVPNNGFCQSNDLDYCKKQSAQESESRKYRYVLTFAGTESSDYLVATNYEPIYCNLDTVKNDLSAMAINSGTRVDITCDSYIAANWRPTEWFVARNGGYTDDIDALLSNLKLNIYDVANEFVIKVSDGGSTITTGGLDYSKVVNDKLVHSFTLTTVN